MHLGTAFQIVDDVLDYSGDEAATGKHLGDDLAEGKPTLPLIHAIQNGSPAAGGAACGSAIETGGGDSFPGVLDRHSRHRRAGRQARSHGSPRPPGVEAHSAAAGFKFKDSLVQLADVRSRTDF
jgi:octaprenyl-diphosphate synthase